MPRTVRRAPTGWAGRGVAARALSLARLVGGPAALALLVAGCAPLVLVPASYQSERWPPPGEVVEVDRGGIVYRIAGYHGDKGAKMLEPFSEPGLPAVTADTMLVCEVVDGREGYCSPAAEPAAATPRICFLDDHPDKRFDRYWVAGEPDRIITLAQKIEYRPQRIAWNLEKFMDVLTFEGFDDGVLRLTQEVYRGDLGQPDRRETLRLEASSRPASVIVDGVELEIIEATASRLRYRVLDAPPLGDEQPDHED